MKPMLLMLEKERALIPISPLALTVTQSSASRLNTMYAGGLLLSDDGSVKTINSLVVGRFYGNTFGRRFLSALIGVRHLHVELSSAVFPSLAEIKRLVTQFVKYDAESSEPMIVSADVVGEASSRIGEASSVKEIFAAIRMPRIEDCLDVL